MRLIKIISLVSLIQLLAAGSLLAQLSDEWKGEFSGEVSIYNEKGLAQTVRMQLNIMQLTDTSLQWKITYGEGESADIRDYRVFSNPKDKKQLILDELNGIKLYLSYINEGLYSWFGLNTSELLLSYELRDGQIQFSAISSKNDSLLESGGSDQNTPEVFTQPVRVVQKAILKKNQ